MTASPRSRRRVLVGVSGVAALSLGVGLVAGSRLMSPEEAAARTAAPSASQITVPVEKKALSSKVVARGDTSFDGAVNVRVETSGMRTPPVVTGKVPKVGSTIHQGKALLEIAGRPVIGLAGVLPMYRTLTPGSKGPDVLQLEQTLDELGFDPGTVNSTYDGGTARAVEELYEAAGYEAPEPEEQLKQAVESADKSVDGARNALRQAQAALRQAKAGPGKAGPGKADTSVQQGAVDDAQENLDDAREALAEAKFKAGTPLPVSEVVFVKTLPRRVDDVKVERGGTVNGVVMSVSGASLVVTVQVDAQTKERLRTGLPASLDLGDGTVVAATVRRITRNADKFDVVVAPKSLTASQLERLREANVRVTIPVSSTNGKVLAVPVAALSAGPGGESRVEVQREGRVELVRVTVGLSADGYAQVTPVGGNLAVGDQVVVGR